MSATDFDQTTGTDGVAVRSFHVDVSEAKLTELRERIRATKWPPRETVAVDSQVGAVGDDPGGSGQPGFVGQVVQGHPAGDLTRDDVLDNITLYWFTNTAVSAARLYWENKVPTYLAVDVSVPAAVSSFPYERYQPPRSWTEQAYRNPIYYNRVDRGGHFAAWEQPQLFAEEVRAAFRSLRQ